MLVYAVVPVAPRGPESIITKSIYVEKVLSFFRRFIS